MKVLIVEDNADLALNIQEFLQKEGYVCESSNTVSQAQEKLIAFQYDCIILDIMLPDGNGLDLLKYIKENKIKSCVLIISAKNALDDKVNGLELGADDYLTKPFHLPELNARLKAIYRRNVLDGDDTIVFNELVVNTNSLEVKVNNKLVELTKKS